MERLSEERYPALGEEQFDFNRALIGMLNCRRYLESQGFTELRESGNGESYAKIVFPDGYSLETEDFARASQTSSRSDLLENMIKNNAIIIPLATYGKNNSRKQVLHSSHLRDDYYVQICIEDTARRHPNIFKRKSCEAKLFSTNYFSRLRKDLITRKDIKEFERIQQKLEDAIRQDTIVTPSSGIVSPKLLNPNVGIVDVDEYNPEIITINPWDVDIPKLGEENGTKE